MCAHRDASDQLKKINVYYHLLAANNAPASYIRQRQQRRNVLINPHITGRRIIFIENVNQLPFGAGVVIVVAEYLMMLTLETVIYYIVYTIHVFRI